MTDKNLRQQVKYHFLVDGTCGGCPVNFSMLPSGSARYTGTSVRCGKCGHWYNTWEQTSECPHISLQSPVPAPSLPIETELKLRKEGYVFARTIDKTGASWIVGVNSCPYGPAYPNGKNLEAEAWYAGWWFYWYVVKRWAKVAARHPA